MRVGFGVVSLADPVLSVVPDKGWNLVSIHVVNGALGSWGIRPARETTSRKWSAQTIFGTCKLLLLPRIP